MRDKDISSNIVAALIGVIVTGVSIYIIWAAVIVLNAIGAIIGR